MSTRPVSVALALALAACSGPNHIGVGYAISNGAALMPPSGTRGTTAMITYHEAGGPVSFVLVTLLSLLGMQDPDKDVSVKTTTKTEDLGDVVRTTTTTTTTVTPTTAAEHDARVANNRALWDAIPEVTAGFSVDIGVARESFGGDTRATTFDFAYHVPLSDTTDFSVGLGFRGYTFNHRTLTHVVSMGGNSVTAVHAMDPVDATFGGLPVRLRQVIAPRTAMFLEMDLNLAALTEDYGENHPSLYIVGFDVTFPVVRLRGTVTASRIEASSLTYGLEAIVGF